MANFTTISKPTLIIDENKALNNLRKMSEKIARNNIIFRPHFKTHQSAVIGEMFRSFNVSAITVSSVGMANYFSNHGWQDILIAFPVNIREITEIVKLAKRIKLSLLIESLESAVFVDRYLENSVDCWIKIDVGTKRTGIHYSNQENVLHLVNSIKSMKNLKFIGLLSHAGHSYKTHSLNEIESIYWDSIRKLTRLKFFLQMNGCEELLISVGDTPSASVMSHFGEIDEMRPGNFIFYDMQQYQLGVCNLKEIAVCLVCPVVALHPERNEIVIYGGAIHFSKDFYIFNENLISYGGVVLLNTKTWNDHEIVGYVKSLSQEHGVIQFPDQIPDSISIGGLIGVYPAHSCLSVQALRGYVNLDGKSIPTMLS